MVKTKSVYDPIEASDGKRFLITRYWPRWLSKDKLKPTGWIRNLAPSKKLLKDWKDGKITWQQYELRYSAEMRDQQEVIQELANLAASGIITLLCFEKEDNPHCHRHLLKKMIENQTSRSGSLD